MKKTLQFILALLAITLVSCNKPQPAEERMGVHPNYSYNGVIYELNTRQFTPEGTFRAAEEHLPELKNLGVDIIWMMPLQEIGVEGRKGSLGSYYAIKDYCSFNHEFGTREDFEHFLKTAHEMGFKVILDWVANHTAPDSEWTKNDGWHYRDSLTGELMVQYDWTDIAKLNYNNQDMRNAMLQAMHFWMDEIGIDGFRCDVAGEVPVDFWEWAMADLRLTHPDMFTLAEDEDKADTLTASAFDMYYGWTLHKHMNLVAQGKEPVEALWEYFAKADTTVRPEAIRMNFTSNHDENSWSGTEFERMGKASDAFAAFTYVIPGMPLIYTGQEFALDHRLEFFEKDSFQCHHVHQFKLYQDLNELRHTNPALMSNELGSPLYRIENDNPAIFSCARLLTIMEENEKGELIEGSEYDNIVLGIFNFSGEEQTVTLETAGLEGDYTCICGMPVTVGTEDIITLLPWEWLIYSR